MHFTEATKKQDVYKLFDVLQRQCNSQFHSAHQHALNRRPEEVINYKMERAKHWVQWWIRANHLKILCKLFSKMASSDWDNEPCKSNGVELANSLAKNCDRKMSLYGAMQSL